MIGFLLFLDEKLFFVVIYIVEIIPMIGELRMSTSLTNNEIKDAAIIKLNDRGVKLIDIAGIVYEMQVPYQPELTLDLCLDSVYKVLEKREILHAVLVGIELDTLAEKGMLSEPLQSIISSDDGLFGCDETLAIGATFVYGSIAVTTFGHLDKNKTGIIKRLDTKTGERVNTFLDDLVSAIAASAASRVAHRYQDLHVPVGMLK